MGTLGFGPKGEALVLPMHLRARISLLEPALQELKRSVVPPTQEFTTNPLRAPGAPVPRARWLPRKREAPRAQSAYVERDGAAGAA
eukprot:4471099-Pyramimonas_sp.AAC.1